MELIVRQQYKKKKRNTHRLRVVWFLVIQHKVYVCLRKKLANSHYKMTKTVYMFSNIFVLYYIQLSLLKWNTDDYYITGQRNGQLCCLPHVTCRTVTCCATLQFAILDRNRVKWCCFQWVLPIRYSTLFPRVPM